MGEGIKGIEGLDGEFVEGDLGFVLSSITSTDNVERGWGKVLVFEEEGMTGIEGLEWEFGEEDLGLSSFSSRGNVGMTGFDLGLPGKVEVS